MVSTLAPIDGGTIKLCSLSQQTPTGSVGRAGRPSVSHYGMTPVLSRRDQVGPWVRTLGPLRVHGDVRGAPVAPVEKNQNTPGVR